MPLKIMKSEAENSYKVEEKEGASEIKPFYYEIKSGPT